MAKEKGFFGATKSEINRMRNEVSKDVFHGKLKTRGGKRKRR